MKRITKNKLLQTAAVSIALSFTIMFFSPVDIFLGNMREFTVSASHIILPMLISAVLLSAAGFAVLTLMLIIYEPLWDILVNLLFGLLLAMYAQLLFMNGKMVQLTGSKYDYTSDTAAAVANLVVYCVLLLTPALVKAASYSKPDSKLLHWGKGRVIPYCCGLVFAMQLVGTLSTVPGTDFDSYSRNYRNYLSYEQSLSLSKDKNIVVFLADRLDSFWLDGTIEKYPELKEKLGGFTFYQNNVSHTTQTFPSVLEMLTNRMYDGENQEEFMDAAWAGETLPKRLVENDWNVSLVMDSLTEYKSIDAIIEQCSNIGSCSPDKTGINYMGRNGVIPMMQSLSLGKLMPYYMKDFAVGHLYYDISRDFVLYDSSIEDVVPMTTSTESDIKYLNYMRSKGLDCDSEKNAFTFVHLNFSHDPSDEQTAIWKPIKDADIYDTTRASFEIIFEYMEQMKRLGVYDNSTIIILGDHGRAPYELEVEMKDELESPIVTSLLIKPEGSSGGELKFDGQSELSNVNFPASVLQYAGIAHDDFGFSYSDIIDGELHPERTVRTFAWHGFKYVEPKCDYSITGDARNFDNWQRDAAPV